MNLSMAFQGIILIITDFIKFNFMFSGVYGSVFLSNCQDLFKVMNWWGLSFFLCIITG